MNYTNTITGILPEVNTSNYAPCRGRDDVVSAVRFLKSLFYILCFHRSSKMIITISVPSTVEKAHINMNSSLSDISLFMNTIETTKCHLIEKFTTTTSCWLD